MVFIFRSLTNPVVKDEQALFVNRKANGWPEAKATKMREYTPEPLASGWPDFSFSLTLFHGICQRTLFLNTEVNYCSVPLHLSV